MCSLKVQNVLQFLKINAVSTPLTRHLKGNFMKLEQRNIVTSAKCNKTVSDQDKEKQTFRKGPEPVSSRVLTPPQTTQNIILSKEILHRTEISQNEDANDILSNLPPEDDKKLKVLKLEYDVWMSLGVKVPDNMTDDMWLELLRKCPSPSSRRKTYSFWFKKEKRIQNDKIKRLERQKVRNEEKQVEESEPREIRNTIFFFIRDQTMNKHAMNNMAHAMVHGPHLVIDCGYDDNMRDRELKDLSRQLSYCYGFNKDSPEPFHIAFMNCDMKGLLHRLLQKAIPTLDEIPLTVTEKSYLDIFPKKDIVYLTPDADETLKTFDYNDIYVVGGIVDRAHEEPLTLASAKREGLRYAKFPLEKHLDWNQGTKSLTLDQVFKILMELKTSQDWKKALQHVPTRKLR